MLTEILVQDSDEALLIRLQYRPSVVRWCKATLLGLALIAAIAPIIAGPPGAAVTLCSLIAIIPLTLPVFLSRYYTEWLVDLEGVTATTENGPWFVPFSDIVDFQYNPWVPPATEHDVGHGGGIEAVLTGPSLSGDSLLFGRGMAPEDLTHVLSRLRAKLPATSSG